MQRAWPRRPALVDRPRLPLHPVPELALAEGVLVPAQRPASHLEVRAGRRSILTSLRKRAVDRHPGPVSPRGKRQELQVQTESRWRILYLPTHPDLLPASTPRPKLPILLLVQPLPHLPVLQVELQQPCPL